jgi:hypothetical protein
MIQYLTRFLNCGVDDVPVEGGDGDVLVEDERGLSLDGDDEPVEDECGLSLVEQFVLIDHYDDKFDVHYYNQQLFHNYFLQQLYACMILVHLPMRYYVECISDLKN